jgi:hypothetical protein
LKPSPLFAGTLALCSRESCPCWRGQLGLFAGTDDAICWVVGYRPETSCQAPVFQRDPAPAEGEDIWSLLAAAERLEAVRLAAARHHAPALSEAPR